MEIRNILKIKNKIFCLGSLGGLLLISALMLSACGGGDASTGASTGSTGVVNISLTDAEGDFLTYSVDVLSLTLTQANGTVVQTLPVKTRVDFARYTDLTEFLTAASVPRGLYKKGEITLDYSNADIQVEDANGNAVSIDPADIRDSNGDPITVLTSTVKLEGVNALPITPGIPRSLTLDFDLQASNMVELNTTPPQLIVDPVLLAEVEKTSTRVQRLRGPLQSVNTENSTFHVYIRPFYARLFGTRPFGSVRVFSNADTMYEIDGTMYQGDTGLQALALKNTLTAVIVRGVLKFKPVRFEASEVYAGSSVPGGDSDVVTGSVVARSGDSLTLRGATLMRRNGTVVFNDNVTVQLAASTTVRKQQSLDQTLTIDAISVGQHLIVFGTLTNDQVNAMTLDASNGYARLLYTSLRGSVVTNDDSPAFDLNLDTINGRNVAIYDFAGTGIDTAHDADPASYELATSTLDVSAVSVGSDVKVKGFVREFGQAPKDFDATAVAYPPAR